MRVAAVDLGTNSLRLLVADLPVDPRTRAARPGLLPGDVLRRLEIVRLGEGVDRSGRVTAAALDRVGRVLESYAADVARLGATAVRAVATSATRDAANRDEVVDLVRRRLGTTPDVLDGAAEAALTYAGAVAGLPPGTPGPVLVVDVGGGSTELALGPASGTAAAGGPAVPDAVASLDVGSVRLTERHLTGRHLTGPDGPLDVPRSGAVEAAVTDVRAALASALAAGDLPLAGVRTVVAVAGTATSVAALATRASTYDDVAVDGSRLDRARLDEVVAWLLDAPRSERAASPAVHPGRVDVLPGGALVLATVLAAVGEAGGPGTALVSVRDLLDGAAASLLPAGRAGSAGPARG